MKHILCFGDSNTYGTVDFAMLDRFDIQTRWTGILAAGLGSDYRVIEEGMPGRTTAFEDPLKDYRSGRHYLVPCLNSHRPLDLVIVMLGTNDLQGRYSASPVDVATGMEILVDIIVKAGAGSDGRNPQIIIVSPPPVGSIDHVEEPCWIGAIDKCRALPKLYADVARRYGCHFINSQDILTTDDLGRDGLHLQESGHSKLGNLFTQKIREITAARSVATTA